MSGTRVRAFRFRKIPHYASGDNPQMLSGVVGLVPRLPYSEPAPLQVRGVGVVEPVSTVGLVVVPLLGSEGSEFEILWA